MSIKDLNLVEKMRLMEELWSEISQDPGMEPPQWQKKILENRKLLYQEGRAKVLDWEEAKEGIAGDIHEKNNCR